MAHGVLDPRYKLLHLTSSYFQLLIVFTNILHFLFPIVFLRPTSYFQLFIDCNVVFLFVDCVGRKTCLQPEHDLWNIAPHLHEPAGRKTCPDCSQNTFHNVKTCQIVNKTERKTRPDSSESTFCEIQHHTSTSLLSARPVGRIGMSLKNFQTSATHSPPLRAHCRRHSHRTR